MQAQQQQFIMLPALLLIPLFGALLLCTMSGTTPAEESRVKNVALVTSLVTFVLSMVM
jgi:NADH:ubiquinone oxidoreductase subunit 4 (subunit M)